MHGTLAPSGFTPVPEQNTQFTAGSFTSTFPFPLQTWQLDISESNSKGSFPVPLQYAHVIIFFMAYIELLIKKSGVESTVKVDPTPLRPHLLLPICYFFKGK
jgi:hypothetical protein